MTLTYFSWFTEQMELNGEPIMLIKSRFWLSVHVLVFIVSDIILNYVTLCKELVQEIQLSSEPWQVGQGHQKENFTLKKFILT